MNFDISGAAIYLRIPTGIPVLGDFVITETGAACPGFV